VRFFLFVYSVLWLGNAAVCSAEDIVARDLSVHSEKSAQARLLNEQLAELDKLYGKTAALLKTLEVQTAHQKQNVAKIQGEIQSLTLEINKHNQELAGQVRAMYAMGQKERLKMLLNQQDPILSSRIMAYYDYLNAHRVSQLNRISDTLHHLEQLKQQNESESIQLEKNLAQKREEQLTIEQLKKQRSQFLKQATPDFLSNEQQINRLKDSEIELRNLLASLQVSSSDLNAEIAKARKLRQANLETNDEAPLISSKPLDDQKHLALIEKAPSLITTKPLNMNSFPALEGDFVKLKGTLTWPVKGALMQKFGSAREEGKLDGVLIAADEGADIHSITDGKVVYADWMRGYGLIIIIDHGKGYISLYAFNQSLYKKVGDVVAAGDVIASVGLSGGHDRASLYFGIRKKGKPLDPMDWCK
jgi:septal ring factor EnvC (AmiA/AmiB activator)